MDGIGESEPRYPLFAGRDELVRLFEEIVGVVLDYPDVLRGIFGESEIVSDAAISVRLGLGFAHEDGVMLGKDGLGLGVLGEDELTLFDDYLAPLASYFEAIGARRVVSGGDEHSRSPVCEFAYRGHVVLHADVPPHRGGGRRHRDGKPRKPCEKIELMRALIEEHSSSLSPPGAAPAALRVVGAGTVPVGDYPHYPCEFPESAALDELFGFDVEWVGTLIEHHAEKEIGVLFCFLVHLSHLFCVHSRRLIAEHVEPRSHRGYRYLGMEIVRSLHHHDVDEPRGEHILVIFKDFHPFQVFLGILAPCGVDVADGGEPRALDEPFEFGEYLGVECALFAHSHYAVSDFFHAFASAMSFLRPLYCQRNTSFRDAHLK